MICVCIMVGEVVRCILYQRWMNIILFVVFYEILLVGTRPDEQLWPEYLNVRSRSAGDGNMSESSPL